MRVMHTLATLLRPRSLVGRVFALFALGMLFFAAAGLGVFYHLVIDLI